MNPSRVLALILTTAALGVSACGADSSSSGGSSAAGETTTATTSSSSTTTTGSAGAGQANTAAVVKAAHAFLATLSDDQRTSVVKAAGDGAVKQTWSNLPAAMVPRTGIALADMNDAQQQAALALMKVVLSDQGYQELQDVRAADDYLAQQGGGQGPGGAGTYGGDNYYFAFYGEPSADQPWLLQYTGHHLTYNIAYHGDDVSFGPAFEGVEPITFTDGGKTIAPLSDEAGGFASILKALTAQQKQAAQLSQSYDDLLLGAQNDGPFPSQPEGVLVSDLSQDAQDAVTKTIRAYVGDLDDAAADAIVATYVKDYDKTKVAYAGGTDTEQLGFYMRIDGPKVWIEISTQHGIVLSGNHYHSIYREQGGDYGGS